MSFKLPKIYNNNLFVPAVLIYSLLVVMFISNLNYKETSYSYSYLLGASSVLILLKIFVTTFGSLSQSLQKEKSIIAMTQLLLFCTQVAFVWLGANHLTRYSYPEPTVRFFLLCNLLFFVQIFLAKIPKTVTLAVFSLATYSVFVVFLYWRLFSDNTQLFILMLQASGYFSVFVELLQLLVVSRFYTRPLAKNLS